MHVFAVAAIAAFLDSQPAAPRRSLDTPEPDACSSDSWARPATARVQLGAFDPEYVPEVFVVAARHLGAATNMLASGDAVALSVAQASELTGVDVSATTKSGERLYLIRALATDTSRGGFAVYDAGGGRALVEHAVDAWRRVEIRRQPLVVSFRGPLREVYMRCVGREKQ